MSEKQQMKHHYGMNIIRKLTMKKKYIRLIFVLYFVLLSLLLNRQYRILKISELRQSIILPFDDERRNEQPYITQQTVNRSRLDSQMVDNTLSLEVELARRMLSKDEKELWNFLAAQLQLHFGHFIEKLPTIDNVVTSVQQYESVLHEDVNTYKSKLEAETSVTATSLLRILTHIRTNLTQLFHNTHYDLENIRNSSYLLASNFSDDTKSKLRSLHIKIRALLHQMVSQTGQESNWYSQSRELGDKIQKQIQQLQNPRDCSSARKLLCGVCSELEECGFACLAHHIGLCLVTAYLSNRTMILDCSGWRYSSRGWDVAFLPITNCTQDHMKERSIPEFKTAKQLPEVFNQTIPKTIRMKLPIRIPGTGIFPPVVPRDIFQKILRFNSYPPSWWMGQFKIWTMRLKDEEARDVDKHFQIHNVTGTIVGLHVRRTDKTREAAYHPLDEYMVHVAERFDTYERSHPNVERRIYLATDESALIEEARHRYPRYEFIHDRNISSSAAVKSRYNEQSLRGTLKDIYSLVRCDFVVCTFSSTLCRLVYELSQTQYGETHSFQSLDDTYFVGGEPLGHGRVRRDHIPLRKEEISVKQGDVVSFLGNHWDGYALAVEPQSGKTGLIPALKIDEIFKMYNYSSKIK